MRGNRLPELKRMVMLCPVVGVLVITGSIVAIEADIAPVAIVLFANWLTAGYCAEWVRLDLHTLRTGGGP